MITTLTSRLQVGAVLLAVAAMALPSVAQSGALSMRINHSSGEVNVNAGTTAKLEARSTATTGATVFWLASLPTAQNGFNVDQFVVLGVGEAPAGGSAELAVPVSKKLAETRFALIAVAITDGGEFLISNSAIVKVRRQEDA